MRWFARAAERLKELTSTDPVDCPRGWGKVSFFVNFETFWPWFSVERTCPISGAENCSECTYAYNPDAFKLSAQLEELDRLRREQGLSDEDYLMRRQALLRLHAESGTGRGFLVAAWILGPLGICLMALGSVFATFLLPPLWSVAAAGALLLTLSISFFAIHRSRRDALDHGQV